MTGRRVALKHSYTLLAPIYDTIVGRGSQGMRRASLTSLGELSGHSVLLAGVGTGLDLPLLPDNARYTGVDITRAMLRRAMPRAQQRGDVDLCQADVMALPFSDAHFDTVVLHLILAVAPQPARTLQEASRVLRPGGHITIVDKFLRAGQFAPTRQVLNLLTRHVATQTNIVLEELLANHPELVLVEDEPQFLGGWFRRVLLRKSA